MPFVAADHPEADRTMLQMLAVFAEHEARQTSARTKAALAAAKARGVRLGSPTPEVGSALGVAALKAKADAYAREVEPLVEQLIGQGMSLRAVARELEARRVPRPRGGKWTATAVKRTLS